MQNRKRDTDVQNRILDSVGEGEGGMFWENSTETSILSRVKQIATQVGCMRQVLRAGALGRPRGMGWEGRWEGGSGWGTHVNPWLIHVNVWQKPLQYCEVISLQLIKINGKKKKRILEWVAISCSRESSQLRDPIHISCISCIGKLILLPLGHRLRLWCH